VKRIAVIVTPTALLLTLFFLWLRPRVDTPDWLNWGGPSLLAALVTLGLVPPLRVLARRIGLLDHPDTRKQHQGAVPLVGGLAVYGGMLVTVLVYPVYLLDPAVRAIMLAGALLLVIGVLDDRYEVSATLKLLFQVAAVAVVMSGGVMVTFLPAVWWGTGLEVLITAGWLIGVTNAVNFLDGVDGLATSLTITTALAFGLVAVLTGQPFFLLLCATLAGACVGFLPYNFRPRPASAFLGDAGATLLGFMLASIAIVGKWGGSSGTTLDIIVPLLILGVPVFDTTFITVTRIADGRIRTFREWLEYTGRDHFHHRLLNLGLSRFDTVGFICLLSAILALSAVILMGADSALAVLSLLQSVIIFSIIGRFMLFIEHRDRIQEGSRNGSAG
jgi:UDP-GlcNAc:undecaprenyl-phosphate GlcNAc-1-phosphate transferase